jgi:hypothetical protein
MSKKEKYERGKRRRAKLIIYYCEIYVSCYASRVAVTAILPTKHIHLMRGKDE